VWIEWAYDFFEEVGDRGDGAYLNYIDPLLRDWKQKYYGGNYDRLSKIKKAVDPRTSSNSSRGFPSKFQPDGRAPARPRTSIGDLATLKFKSGRASIRAGVRDETPDPFTTIRRPGPRFADTKAERQARNCGSSSICRRFKLESR